MCCGIHYSLFALFIISSKRANITMKLCLTWRPCCWDLVDIAQRAIKEAGEERNKSSSKMQNTLAMLKRLFIWRRLEPYWFVSFTALQAKHLFALMQNDTAYEQVTISLDLRAQTVKSSELRAQTVKSLELRAQTVNGVHLYRNSLIAC